MKKIILTSAIIFATVAATFAEGPTLPNATDQTTLNVILNPIQTLVVNPAQKTVDLEYKNISDYAAGVSSTQEDHLKIYSTGGFIVTVQSAIDDMARAKGSETISASTIKIKAENGSTNALTGATVGTEVSLSTTPTSLINSSTGGVDKNFNITYSGMGSDAYVNKYFKNETPTVYTTTVTYAIVAQ